MGFTNISLFFIFVTLGLYFVSQITTNDPRIPIRARRGLRTVEDPKPDIHKADGNARRYMKQANSMEETYDAISNKNADIVYHIDYHGVTTHPSPAPKHP